mmetsp:Transcript_34328/g.110826  ORF Transcript_34328/g.110826 Transcript_34328/m.110826 type:complete len:227 (+) Transcript_34328:993-1673(+)
MLKIGAGPSCTHTQTCARLGFVCLCPRVTTHGDAPCRGTAGARRRATKPHSTSPAREFPRARAKGPKGEGETEVGRRATSIPAAALGLTPGHSVCIRRCTRAGSADEGRSAGAVLVDILVGRPGDGVLKSELPRFARLKRQVPHHVVGHPIVQDPVLLSSGGGGGCRARLTAHKHLDHIGFGRCDELHLNLVLGGLGEHLHHGEPYRRGLGVCDLGAETVRGRLLL